MVNYITVYNDMLKVNGERKLSPDELFLYGHLYTKRTYENYAETSIPILMNQMKKKKKEIIELLNNLTEKGYIKIDEFGENKPYFTITFPPQSGYVKIPYETYRNMDKIEFYIYCFVDMFGETGREVSFQTWKYILNLSLETVRKTINSMVENGKLYKISGTYYENNGKIKQGRNTYFTRPDEETLKKIEIYNKKINKDKQIKEIVKKESSISPVNVDSPFNHEYPHRWKNYDVRLDVKDFQYYLLWKDNDEEFKQVAEKRIEIISKTKEGKYAIEKQLHEAEEINRRIIQRQKDEQRKIEEENLFNKIKNSKRTIISPVDGSMVEMNENILLSQIKYIYYINNEKIEKISIHDLMEGRKFTLSNQEKIDNKIMEIITNRQFTTKHIQEIREWIYSIMSKENEGREPDEEWEGDIYSFNGDREINDSLKERLYRMKKSLICQ